MDDLVDNIVLAFEISSGVVFGLIGSFQVYLMAKNFKNISTVQGQINHLEKHNRRTEGVEHAIKRL